MNPSLPRTVKEIRASTSGRTALPSLGAALGALLLGACASAAGIGGSAPSALQPLQVSDNGRFLARTDGAPFFWLGDTAWQLFSRTVRRDTTDQPAVAHYLRTRAEQGFTVIQSVLLSFADDPLPNPYGHAPFVDGDYARPYLVPGPENDYWDHADHIVAKARENQLYLALLPVWLSDVEDDNPMVRDPAVAYRYGHFLGARYGEEPHIVWILGGDPHRSARNVGNPTRLALVRAMAEGIADAVNRVDRYDGEADYRTTLMSFHPPGGNHSSSEHLHDEPWLDFNMIQTTTRFDFRNYETVSRDYQRTPVKPTFDSEVAYERSFSLDAAEERGRRISPWEVRRAAYWNVFAGGFGHTYGHRSFIQWTRAGEDTGRGGDVPWFRMLHAPGALDMAHLRALIQARPFLTRVPDPSVISHHGGTLQALATRDSEGSYVLVYLPAGDAVTVRLDALRGSRARASWFDPREGTYQVIGEYPPRGTREFIPPSQGPDADWVLVLDDAS